MGFEHEREAWGLELPTTTKVVLLRLAWHACERCGLAWPGVPSIAKATGCGETAIRASLRQLEARGLISPRAYATGGRGRTTEYVVLPYLAGLSTSPCGKCVENLAPPGEKASRGEGFRAIPIASGGENPSPGEAQPSENQNHHRARAREGGAAAPQTRLDLPPTSPTSEIAQNRARATNLANAVTEHLAMPPRAPTPKRGA